MLIIIFKAKAKDWLFKFINEKRVCSLFLTSLFGLGLLKLGYSSPLMSLLGVDSTEKLGANILFLLLILPTVFLLWYYRNGDRREQLEKTETQILESQYSKGMELFFSGQKTQNIKKTTVGLRILTQIRQDSATHKKVIDSSQLFRNANLKEAKLGGAKLGGADLVGVNLEGAYLREADLMEAKLVGAYLREAYLIGADLGGADLVEVNLEKAKLEGASLREADLIKAKLGGAYLEEADLRGANLRVAKLEGAELIGANLEGASLRVAKLEGAKLIGANLEGACLVGAKLEGAYLERAKLLGANLERAGLDTTFDMSTFETTDLFEQYNKKEKCIYLGKNPDEIEDKEVRKSLIEIAFIDYDKYEEYVKELPHGGYFSIILFRTMIRDNVKDY